MASPNTMNGSDDDVPVPNNIPNNRPGRLEIVCQRSWSFVALDGNDYLDLNNSLLILPLDEGTICFWVKQVTLKNRYRCLQSG